MAGPEFFQTRLGMRFFEGTMPALVDALKQLNTTLQGLVAQRNGCTCGAAASGRAAPAQTEGPHEG